MSRHDPSEHLKTKPCEWCGKPFHKDPNNGEAVWQRRRFCSTACAYAFRKGKKRGAEHHAWRGGRALHGDGYVQVRIPDDHPYAGMRRNAHYILEHRLVMAEHLGRALRPDETVHHRNGRRDDNRLENLELRSGKHGAGAAMCCARCGSTDLVPVEV
jgi:hypothetical protein